MEDLRSLWMEGGESTLLGFKQVWNDLRGPRYNDDQLFVTNWRYIDVCRLIKDLDPRTFTLIIKSNKFIKIKKTISKHMTGSVSTNRYILLFNRRRGRFLSDEPLYPPHTPESPRLDTIRLQTPVGTSLPIPVFLERCPVNSNGQSSKRVVAGL